jgi:hypothetical protein
MLHEERVREKAEVKLRRARYENYLSKKEVAV